MFTFKEYNPSKRTFTRVQSENSTSSSPSTPPPPETRHAITPEAAKPPSLPSSAVRHASNAFLTLESYVSNAFQQLSTSMSRSSLPKPPWLDEPHSPSGLSFSSLDSPRYNRQTTPPNRQTTPPYNRQTTPLYNRQITSSHNRQTTPDNSTFESITHIQAPPLNVDGDEDDAYILPPTLNAVDESDEENVTARIPKRRGRKVILPSYYPHVVSYCILTSIGFLTNRQWNSICMIMPNKKDLLSMH